MSQQTSVVGQAQTVAGFEVESVFGVRPQQPFALEVIDFLSDLSQQLLRDPRARVHPDVATFAFWCRRSALERQRKEYQTGQRLGRGVIFHVAPGNVPVNFAYSLVAGLLAGNGNIVRLPSAEFEQVEMITSTMSELVATRHPTMRDYIGLLRYDRSNRATTDRLSQRCNVRIVWGGDETIAEIRRSPIPARAFDVTFADRYSLCAIDAGAYLADADPVVTARDFYNDTYLFDQNACTAPHLVVWFGSAEDVRAAQERFWRELHNVVRAMYALPSGAEVDKLTTAYLFAAQHEGCRISRPNDNLIVRAELQELPTDLDDFRSSCGFFYERHATTLDELIPLVNERYQTLAYFGLDRTKLLDFVLTNGLTGIDRVVPIGQTLDFDLEWDGYRLIDVLSRVIVTK